MSLFWRGGYHGIGTIGRIAHKTQLNANRSLFG